MNKRIYALAAAVSLSALAAAGCSQKDERGGSGENGTSETVETVEDREYSEEMPDRQIVDIGEKAPTFRLETLDGEVYRLDELRGKPVLINFFSVSCEYCRQKMPDLNRLYNEMQGEAEVLLVNAGDTREQVESFREEFGLDAPVLLDEDVQVSLSYMVRAVPYTTVLDSEGVINTIRIGPMSYDEMRMQLEMASN